MAGRVYRSRKQRMIAGVAGGLAEYFEVDVTLIRLLWVLVALCVGGGLVAYLIAWLLIPERPQRMPGDAFEEPPPLRERRLCRSRRRRVLGGVAGGLAEFLGTDVVLVRLAWVLLALCGGTGILAYIVAWIIMPEEP